MHLGDAILISCFLSWVRVVVTTSTLLQSVVVLEKPHPSRYDRESTPPLIDTTLETLSISSISTENILVMPVI